MEFPYGKAPLFILLTAIATGIGVLITHSGFVESRPDLVLTTHSRLHADIYRAKLPEFARRFGVQVEVQVVEEQALRQRLLSAFAAGTDVPDVTELPQNSAFFLRGPIDDVGFMELTDWVEENNLDDRMVESRFSMWQRDGHIFALPHDVHPVMLAYRADIVEDELGINVAQIETWDDFVQVMQPHVRDLDGDGNIDRYALEMAAEGGDTLLMLMLQRGVGMFDAEGHVTLDHEIVAQTIEWYLRQLYGPKRIGYGLGYGQALWQGMAEGLVLFYLTPDWRTDQIEDWGGQALAGKMKLMPVPAWTPGGRRTTTWGATGGAIAKRTAKPELARKLLEFLYVDQTDGGRANFELRILPPAKEAWDLPIFDTPVPFFSGQPIMRLYAELAPDVPPNYATPFTLKAQDKRNQAFFNCAEYYQVHGEEGLHDFVRAELKRQADSLRAIMARSVITEQ